MTRSTAANAFLILLCAALSACSSAVRWEPAATPVAAYPQPQAAPATEQSVATRAVRVARQQVGAPYRYGGATPSGFDCSGLVQYAYRHAGLRVPRTTTALYRTANPVSLSELRPGDILFFYFDNKVGHVALYTGDGRFVHAPSSGKYVVRGSLENQFWRERLVSAGRLY